MPKKKQIKCVVWDLDNTIWQGTLLEGGGQKLCEGVLQLLELLDSRGILQSICSKNEYKDAMERLVQHGIAHYFIYPAIGWANKSDAIASIIESIRIGQDTVAFIDDEQYEIDEVSKYLPELLCINANNLAGIFEDERFCPTVITQDAVNRRAMYQADIAREKTQLEFTGPHEDFLKTLDMRLSILKATASDIQRAVELTQRTNQLNTTGVTYDYEDFMRLIQSDEHLVLVVGLDDKYGSSGKIGLIILNKDDCSWTIELFIMSCRVLSRGIGSVVLGEILQYARANGLSVFAKFKETGKNKMMFMTYMLAGFKVFSSQDGVFILENKLTAIQQSPEYVRIESDLFL